MSFEKTFCSSPWFHMRITNSGTYEYCRWRSGITTIDLKNNIQTKTPTEYFQQTMAGIRQSILDGEPLSSCTSCYTMEQHHKVSGRQRQLLKTGVQEMFFVKSLASSPMKASFDYSQKHQGLTDRTVSDWQIDLGNYCNSACVFCSPEFSSRLATEFHQLKLIDNIPPAAWCDDPTLVEKFVADLCASQELHYLHFIGGETLITPGFHRILESLIDAGISNRITLGFTTNLTTWSDKIINLLTQFKQINLGLSVETMTSTNDYVRWPSNLSTVKTLADRWVALASQHNWLTQLRITPTCLTIHELDTVYEYAWQNNLAVESCNFLESPEFLRIGVLPAEYRAQARQRLVNWILSHPTIITSQVINGRDPTRSQEQLVQDAKSYVEYLDEVEDESYRLPSLIAYLKKLESGRKNSVLNYLPQYEELFRASGY